MTEVRRRWLVFGAVAAALVAALVWVSVAALSVERQRNEMREHFAQESVMRLALARVDSLVTYLVAGESARPYFEYRAFYTERNAFDRQLRPVVEGEVRVPSPLLDASSELLQRFFLLHFQLSPPDILSSPQVPMGNEREVALLRGHITEERLSESSARLAALGEFAKYERLVDALSEEARADSALSRSVVGPQVRDLAATRVSLRELEQQLDFERRNQALEVVNAPLRSQTRIEAAGEQPVEQGPFRGLLFSNPRTGKPELVLVRAVRDHGGIHVQGVWASFDNVKRFLLDQVADLFPGRALDLVPTALEDLTEGPLHGRLASLPAMLVAREGPDFVAPRLSATGLTLLVAWVALLTTLAAVGVLLHRTLDLSERRGRFVSAVTHELRTPLTTFCMYSEMLAEGVVRDEQDVREYLATLRSEAARLRRIVDNVLLYARVEGDGATPAHERVSAVELLEGLVPVLARRAEEAGFELAAELAELPDEAVVDVDGQAVEQILGNLVDNACKYAASAEVRRIELAAAARNGALAVSVRDHGPGVPAGRERSIFDAFRRATGDQSGRIPGIGLGLTLSRGMARQMGGELSLVATRNGGPGATFDLSLPLVSRR